MLLPLQSEILKYKISSKIVKPLKQSSIIGSDDSNDTAEE